MQTNNKLLLIGLANPGKKYAHTRHNLGADTLARWAKNQSSEVLQKVAILIPDTGMNNSGQAVIPLTKRYKHKLIIHDDLELPLGSVKYKESGSASGHNGVKSIHEVLGTNEIPRLRLGVGRPTSEDVSHFVLSHFAPAEIPSVENMMDEASQFLTSYIENLFQKNSPDQNPTDES